MITLLITGLTCCTGHTLPRLCLPGAVMLGLKLDATQHPRLPSTAHLAKPTHEEQCGFLLCPCPPPNPWHRQKRCSIAQQSYTMRPDVKLSSFLAILHLGYPGNETCHHPTSHTPSVPSIVLDAERNCIRVSICRKRMITRTGCT